MVNSVVCMLATCLLVNQVDTPTADVTAAVGKLVRQLDAPESAARRGRAKADRARNRGPAALPTTSGASAEVQLRLGRVRVRLETLRGEEEIQARQVTIAGNELTLPDVLATIEKQTGDKVLDYRGQFGQQAAAKTLNLSLDKQPFWPALDQILDQAGMTIYQYSGEPGLSLVNRSGGELPRYNRGAYAGAFRIEATDITARRDLAIPMARHCGCRSTSLGSRGWCRSRSPRRATVSRPWATPARRLPLARTQNWNPRSIRANLRCRCR